MYTSCTLSVNNKVSDYVCILLLFPFVVGKFKLWPLCRCTNFLNFINYSFRFGLCCWFFVLFFRNVSMFGVLFFVILPPIQSANLSPCNRQTANHLSQATGYHYTVLKFCFNEWPPYQTSNPHIKKSDRTATFSPHINSQFSSFCGSLCATMNDY